MTRSRSLVVVCSLWLAAPVVARAQAPLVPGRAEQAFQAAPAPANLSFGVVPVKRSVADSATSAQFLLDASTKDRVGTVALGWKTGHEQIQLALSGPLDATDTAEPVSLTGLPKGASARLSVNRFHWKVQTVEEQHAAEELCTRLGLTRPECSVRKLAEKFPAESKRLADLEHLNDKPWLFGGEASINRRGFQFLQPGTLEAGSVSKTGFSATGRLGVFAPSLGFLFASYSYRRDFDAAGSASSICRPFGAGEALRCQPAIVGAPTEANESVASVELRRLFKTNVGLSPSVQYDFEAERWLVDVPLYVIPGTGKVSGGVRFNWRSDTKEVTAVVFVGTIFELFAK